jgi:hypothetical protein
VPAGARVRALVLDFGHIGPESQRLRQYRCASNLQDIKDIPAILHTDIATGRGWARGRQLWIDFVRRSVESGMSVGFDTWPAGAVRTLVGTW